MLIVFPVVVAALAAVVVSDSKPPDPSDSAAAEWHSQKRTDCIHSPAAAECNWRIAVSSRRNGPCAIYRLDSLFVFAGQICLSLVLWGAGYVSYIFT